MCAIRLQHTFPAVLRLDNFVSFGSQPGRKQHPIVGIVIDYEDRGTRMIHLEISSDRFRVTPIRGADQKKYQNKIGNKEGPRRDRSLMFVLQFACEGRT